MNDDSCRTRAISRRVPVFFTDVTGGKWGIICRHLVFVQQGANSAAPIDTRRRMSRVLQVFPRFSTKPAACASSICVRLHFPSKISIVAWRSNEEGYCMTKKFHSFSRRVKITYELCERKLSAKLSHFRRYNLIKPPDSPLQSLINNCPRKCTPVNVCI